MAWYPVPSSIHATGQFSSNDTIWKVSDENSATPSWFYELKVVKVTGVTKPVLATRDSRNANPFTLASAEYWDNVTPAGQLAGSALFASIAEVGSKQLSDVVTGLVNLWMDANGKIVATAPTSGSLTIPIPSGGTIVITTQPQYGSISVVSGAIQYAASNGYTGSDSFTYDVHGASGDLISSGGVCSFSTSAATATAIPSFVKVVIDVVGDIRVNCVAGSAVTLYKNTDTNIITTVTDSANAGYVLFSNVARVQTDTFKTKAQKSGLTLSGFSIVTTAKRKPSAISGVTKTVQANGIVSINIAELVADSDNANFF